MNEAMSNQKKRSLIAIVVLILIALGWVLWHSRPDLSAPPATQVTRAKVAIVTWVGYGPLFVAKEKGFFRKHGVDLQIVKIEENGARHSALISGSVDFSISTLDTFANEAPLGLPAICFLKMSDSYGGDGIVARKEIKSIKDLKGKTVAFPKGNPSHFFLIYLMDKAGMSMKDIVPKYMSAGDAGAAFAAGKVDAAVTWEPWLSKANLTGFGHILVTSREKPGLLLDVLLVRNSFAKEHPKVVEEVAQAWFDAVDYCKKHPDESNTIMAKGLGLPKADFVEMLKGDKFSGYDENKRYFGIGSSSPSLATDVFDHAQKIWLEAGLIKKTTRARDVIDTSYIEGLGK